MKEVEKISGLHRLQHDDGFRAIVRHSSQDMPTAPAQSATSLQPRREPLCAPLYVANLLEQAFGVLTIVTLLLWLAELAERFVS